jgi:hypothetical protein
VRWISNQRDLAGTITLYFSQSSEAEMITDGFPNGDTTITITLGGDRYYALKIPLVQQPDTNEDGFKPLRLNDQIRFANNRRD